MPTVRTSTAFETFRNGRAAKQLAPDQIANQDQIKPMSNDDGLKLWQDGPVKEDEAPEASRPPMFTAEDDAKKMLWVVQAEDVPYAPETCEFGKKLESRVIKHSNLTGGATAYSGGEMIVL